MATTYAWSEIHGTDKDGKAVKIMPGDKVTAADLGMSDEEFAELVENGSVREVKFPEDLPSDQSPTDYAKQKLLEMAEQGITPEQVASAEQGVAPEEKAAEAKK
jgi:hypothetical protein